MIWICLCTLFLRITLFQNLDLGPYLPLHLQQLCFSWVDSFRLNNIFAGLICGRSLPPTEKNIFLQLGIYHWVVASGGHLIFLQSSIEKIGLKNKKIVCLFLFTFAFICGFQPPIARSLLSLLIAQSSQRYSLFLTRNQTTLCAGLITLTLFPHWYLSMSFQLSWLTALALNNTSSNVVKCLSVSLILLPLSQTWSLLHLFYNIFFTPVFSHFIFPMTAIFFVIAPWTLWGNQIWDWIYHFMSLLPAQSSSLEPTPGFFIWSYLFSIQTFLLLRKEEPHFK